jgi:hypothetical protein
MAEEEKIIKKLLGANMDIDLVTAPKDIHWKQDKCPWNVLEKTQEHKCAVKNISICPHFCGIEYADKVLCSYPNKNSKKEKERN